MRQQSSSLALLAIAAAAMLSGTATEAFAPAQRHATYPGSARSIKTISTDKSQVHPQSPSSPRLKSSHLQVAASGAALGAIAGAVSGGLFAGGLHAVAGPDHLAALLPRCCGQRWFRAGRVGALWGMGHGVSATLIGVIAFAVKRTLGNNIRPGVKAFFSTASHLTEVAVGLSLILIGIMGIKEAREWKEEIPEGGQPQSLSAAAVDDAGIKEAQKRAVIFNGLLHGFSWDGAPSLAPAIAVATWGGNLAFLSAYAVGTMTTMAIVTTLVGEGTRRAGQIFQRPDIPQKLSMASSILAIGIGAFWCGLAMV